jgi:hypothetical protein
MALNGDGKNPGFIKVASKYSGTAAANLSKYYMGLCYLKMDDYKQRYRRRSKISMAREQ